MTAREEIDRAYRLYDKGDWNQSFKVLDRIKDSNSQETMEILVLYAWIHWKKGEKSNATYYWIMVSNSKEASDVIKSSAHAGLGIYYAEKGDKKEALKHAQFAQDLLPKEATANQNKNLNACGITMAKIGELGKSEEILKKVAKINEQLMKSDDPKIAKEGTLQRAKNGYNLVALVYIPQKRFYEAITELEEEVIPRYKVIGAETDLAAAYHRIAEVNEKIAEGARPTGEMIALGSALLAEEKSLFFWQKHPDDPKRIKTARDNVKRIKDKIEALKLLGIMLRELKIK